MKKYVKHEKYSRFCNRKFERYILLLKSLSYSQELPQSIREFMLERLSLRKNAMIRVRQNTRCVITGRGKSVYSSFKLSRLTFRKLAARGLLTGIKKSSW